MNKHRRLLLNRGFTLLELTCALFVVSTGLFGVIHIYLQGIEKARVIYEYDTALCALNNEIETLRALPWDALQPGEALPFRSDTAGIERLHQAETLVTITDDAALKQVTARIRWIGEHGRRIEKELTTYIACTQGVPQMDTGWEEYNDVS